MKLTARISLILFLMTGILTGCGGSQELQDGYYTAQAQEFSHGWKEYVTIMVKGGSIVSVEYNAENASGFIKSWDNAYMQNMLHSNGTYPNEYTRNYAGQLLEGQGKGQIDAISGASSSHDSFKKLAAAVLEQTLKITRWEMRPEGEIRIYEAADPRAVVQVLTQAGIALEELGLHQQDLESYFLERMGGNGHV